MSSQILFNLSAIAAAVSQERLSVYGYHADNTEAQNIAALSRYLCNLALSEAFYPSIQLCEVTLRNQLHTHIGQKFNEPQWLNGNGILKGTREGEEVVSIKQALIKRNQHASYHHTKSYRKYDEPRAAVGPNVEPKAKHKEADTASSHLWEPVSAHRRGDRRTQDERGHAEGDTCRQFFTPFGGLGVPKGLVKNGGTIVIPELSFGFWTGLLHKRYEGILWPWLLKPCFPYLAKRNRTQSYVFQKLNDIRQLRNRIFHHEKIAHMVNLPDIHQEILVVISS